MRSKKTLQMKKIAAGILIFVMAFGMLGCGGKDSAKELQGTWELTYDMGQMLSDELGEEYADFAAPLEMKLLFAFHEDGTYRMYVEAESFQTNWQAWKSAFIGYMVDAIYAGIDAEGVDRATADQMIQQTYGCTAEEYITQLADEAFDDDAMLEEMDTSGKYEVKGQKLFLAEEGEEIEGNRYDHFAIEGDKLTLSLVDETEDPEVLPGLNYPLTFTRRSE